MTILSTLSKLFNGVSLILEVVFLDTENNVSTWNFAFSWLLILKENFQKNAPLKIKKVKMI